jgi:hypothetical protein
VNANLTYQASVVRIDDLMRQAARERRVREAATLRTFWGAALLRRGRSPRGTHPPVSPAPLLNR